MFKLRYLSIRKKLSLIIMITVLIAVLLLSVVFIGYEYVSTKRSIQNEFSTTASIIASQSGAALLFLDETGLNELLSSLSLNEDVLLSCIYRIDGTLLAARGKDSSRPHCPGKPNPTPGVFHQQKYIQNVPIVVDGKIEGHLYLEVSLERFYRDISITTLFIVAVALLICLFVYLFLSRLQRFISSPILSLTNTAGQIAGTRDYSLRAQRTSSDEIGDLVVAFNGMLETIQQQNNQITRNAEELEEKVAERTRQLSAANANLETSLKKLAVTNNELEAFSYSVSHDLRAPLRAIDGFTQALEEEYGDQLDDMAKNYIQRARGASQKMGLLIQTLLTLSRVSRKNIQLETVDMTALADKICTQLRQLEPERKINIIIQPGMRVSTDTQLLEIALENLINNAWKYTKYQPHPHIEIGRLREDNHETNTPTTIYYIKDNGAGFDATYAGDLFTAFKRLHSADEFEGTGIGLATVARIIHRHHGDIWATSHLGEGTQFFFTLNQTIPEDQPADAFAGSEAYHG